MNEPWRPAEVLQTQLHDLLQQQRNRMTDMPKGRGRDAFCLLAFKTRQDLCARMEYWANMLRTEELSWGLNKDMPWPDGMWSHRVEPPSGGVTEWFEADATVPTEQGPHGFVAMLEPGVPETSEPEHWQEDAWEVHWQKNKAERHGNDKRGKRGAATSQDEEWSSSPGDVGLDGTAIRAFPSPPSLPSPPSRSSRRR